MSARSILSVEQQVPGGKYIKGCMLSIDCQHSMIGYATPVLQQDCSAKGQIDIRAAASAVHHT